MSYATSYKAAAAAAATVPTGWPDGWTFPTGPTWGAVPPGWGSLEAEDVGGVDEALPTSNVAIGTLEDTRDRDARKQNLIYFGSTAINIASYDYLVIDNPTLSMEYGTEDLGPGGATVAYNTSFILDPITADFDPDTVTWNTKPATGSALTVTGLFFTSFALSGTETTTSNLEQTPDSYWIDISSMSGSIYGMIMRVVSNNRSNPANGVPGKPLYGTLTLNSTLTYDSGSLPLLLAAA